jgi:hypothetical protein
LNEVSDEALDKGEVAIKLRMDVDYAYPSRLKSFFYTALGTKTDRNYLKNSKIIAQMINESKRNVKAYWFFTPTTLPDRELLELLPEDRHEVGLHVANNPYAELEHLEKATGRKINFYTVHGTARLLARLMWGRNLWEARVDVPDDFPLKSFYQFPTNDLDFVCYRTSVEQATKIAMESITKGEVLHVHPEWLFQRGTINHRGPFDEVFRRILDVDKELETLVKRKRFFAKIASRGELEEYKTDFVPDERFLKKIAERGIDVFTFLERKWCCSIPEVSKTWLKADDNIGLLNVTTHSDWLERVGKKTRNMIRKAEKSGVKTEVVMSSEKFAEDIWRIYNETPIRQERAFPHYGVSLGNVNKSVLSAGDDTFIGAFLQDELVGFVQLSHGDRIAIISQILSLQKHSDKATNNALISKTVEICEAKHARWLMYGRMGNHPSLDRFKENNGFSKFVFPRFYVTLTRKGRAVTILGLHRDLKDSLPFAIKSPLFPVFNLVSRNKQRLRLWFSRR